MLDKAPENIIKDVWETLKNNSRFLFKENQMAQEEYRSKGIYYLYFKTMFIINISKRAIKVNLLYSIYFF